jgi:hypothetical protein
MIWLSKSAFFPAKRRRGSWRSSRGCQAGIETPFPAFPQIKEQIWGKENRKFE